MTRDLSHLVVMALPGWLLIGVAACVEYWPSLRRWWDRRRARRTGADDGLV